MTQSNVSSVKASEINLKDRVVAMALAQATILQGITAVGIAAEACRAAF